METLIDVSSFSQSGRNPDLTRAPESGKEDAGASLSGTSSLNPLSDIIADESILEEERSKEGSILIGSVSIGTAASSSGTSSLDPLPGSIADESILKMEKSKAPVTHAPESGKEDDAASSSGESSLNLLPESIADESTLEKENSKGKKPKERPISIGTVSSVIGKDYAKHTTSANEPPKTSKQLKLPMHELPTDQFTGEDVMSDSTGLGDYMLGSGFQLDMDVIRDVLEEDDTYDVLHRSAKEHWVTMKEYFKPAFEPFASGDRARADHLLKEVEEPEQKSEKEDLPQSAPERVEEVPRRLHVPETGKEDTGASCSKRKVKVRLLSIGSVSSFVGKGYATRTTLANEPPETTSKPLQLDMGFCGYDAEKAVLCLKSKDVLSSSFEKTLHGTVIIALINHEGIYFAADGMVSGEAKDKKSPKMYTNAKVKRWVIAPGELYTLGTGHLRSIGIITKKLIDKVSEENKRLAESKCDKGQTRVSVEQCASFCQELFKELEKVEEEEEIKESKDYKEWNRSNQRKRKKRKGPKYPPPTFIVGGFYKGHPSIWEVTSSEITEESNYLCRGSGGSQAFRVIDSAYDRSFSEQKCVRLLKGALLAATTSAGVGGLCRIWKMTPTPDPEKETDVLLTQHIDLIEEEIKKEAARAKLKEAELRAKQRLLEAQNPMPTLEELRQIRKATQEQNREKKRMKKQEKKQRERDLARNAAQL